MIDIDIAAVIRSQLNTTRIFQLSEIIFIDCQKKIFIHVYHINHSLNMQIIGTYY